METSAQNLVVLAAVLVALAYLARRGWNVIARRKAAACGGCDSCSAGEKHATPQVISIGGSEAARNGSASQAGSNGAPSNGQSS